MGKETDLDEEVYNDEKYIEEEEISKRENYNEEKSRAIIRKAFKETKDMDKRQ
jgi:hypothetical protein